MRLKNCFYRHHVCVEYFKILKRGRHVRVEKVYILCWLYIKIDKNNEKRAMIALDKKFFKEYNKVYYNAEERVFC